MHCASATSSAPAVIVVRGPLGAEQARTLYARAQVLLFRGRATGIICDVQGPADLSVIEVLARMYVLVSRCGARLELCCAGDELAQLLAFAGLHRLRRLVRQDT